MSNSVRMFLRYQFPAVLWGGIIFIGTSLPGSLVPHVSLFRYDKLIHAGIFFVFALLLARAYRHQQHFPRWAEASAPLSLWTAIVYGIVDEGHQLYIPGRSGDPLDLLADAVGALLGVSAVLAFRALGDRRGVAKHDG